MHWTRSQIKHTHRGQSTRAMSICMSDDPASFPCCTSCTHAAPRLTIGAVLVESMNCGGHSVNQQWALVHAACLNACMRPVLSRLGVASWGAPPLAHPSHGRSSLRAAPVSLLGEVVEKLERERGAAAVVVCPYWTGAPWWACVCTRACICAACTHMRTCACICVVVCPYWTGARGG